MHKLLTILTTSIIISACGNNDNNDWFCKVDGKTMYSMNSKGHLGAASKGCSCSEIRNFEKRVFGEVDEVALKRDFNC